VHGGNCFSKSKNEKKTKLKITEIEASKKVSLLNLLIAQQDIVTLATLTESGNHARRQEYLKRKTRSKRRMQNETNVNSRRQTKIKKEISKV